LSLVFPLVFGLLFLKIHSHAPDLDTLMQLWMELRDFLPSLLALVAF
jgi:hypothetical protein